MNKPDWCPLDKMPDVEYCDAQGKSRESKGSSGICIGETALSVFRKEGCEHRNGYLFCMHNPAIAPPHEYLTTVHVINKQDMEALHGLLHEAIAMRGFMK